MASIIQVPFTLGRNRRRCLQHGEILGKSTICDRGDRHHPKETQITMWQWSPNAKPMDFQHYSKRDHMLSGYEGMEEIRSTAVGVANTTRCWLDLYEEAPSEEVLLGLAQENQEPAQIVSLPERYQETKVLAGSVYQMNQRKRNSCWSNNWLRSSILFSRSPTKKLVWLLELW